MKKRQKANQHDVFQRKRSQSLFAPNVAALMSGQVWLSLTSTSTSKWPSPSPSPSPPLISTSVNHHLQHHQLHLVRFQSDLSFKDILGTRLSHLNITTTSNNQHQHKRHLLMVIIIIVTFITPIDIRTLKLLNHQHIGGVVRPRGWFTARLIMSTS